MWRATQAHLLADRWADPVFSLAGDCLGSSRIGRAEEEEEDDEEEEEEAIFIMCAHLERRGAGAQTRNSGRTR